MNSIHSFRTKDKRKTNYNNKKNKDGTKNCINNYWGNYNCSFS